MSVSTRFREIAQDVSLFLKELDALDVAADAALKGVTRAERELDGWVEAVGEIPRMKLEFKLTPVLMKAHNELDRARLAFVEADCTSLAEAVWALQQKIYRLLNDL
jgi:hypothetical protein